MVKIVLKDSADRNVILATAHLVNFVKIISALKDVKQNLIVLTIWTARITNAKIHVQMQNAAKMQFVAQQITELFVSAPMASPANQQLSVASLNVNVMMTVILINDALLAHAKIHALNAVCVETMLNVVSRIVNQFVHVSLAMLVIQKFNVLNQELLHVNQTLVEETAIASTLLEVQNVNVKLDV